MALNPFFNNFNNSSEQDLHSDLIEESIQAYGYEMYYLPRRGSVKTDLESNADDLYNQDDMSYFDTAYPLEMYIRSVESFEGEGTFLSKFGIEVRDRVGLSVSRRRFHKEVGHVEDFPRPREGDLVFFAMTKKLFEIIYVDNRAMFYPMGQLPLSDLNCEVFEYNGERFSTGIEDIDSIAADLTVDENEFLIDDPLSSDPDDMIVDPAFDPAERDPEHDNEELANEFPGMLVPGEYDVRL